MRARYVILIVLVSQVLFFAAHLALLQEHWSEHWNEVKKDQAAARQEMLATKEELRTDIRSQFQELTRSVQQSVAEANADHKKWVRRTVGEYRELTHMVNDPEPTTTTNEEKSK